MLLLGCCMCGFIQSYNVGWVLLSNVLLSQRIPNGLEILLYSSGRNLLPYQTTEDRELGCCLYQVSLCYRRRNGTKVVENTTLPTIFIFLYWTLKTSLYILKVRHVFECVREMRWPNKLWSWRLENTNSHGSWWCSGYCWLPALPGLSKALTKDELDIRTSEAVFGGPCTSVNFMSRTLQMFWGYL